MDGTLRTVGELAMNFGLVPAGFLFLVVHFVRQNRTLQAQNSKILDQMIDLVKELTEKRAGGRPPKWEV